MPARFPCALAVGWFLVDQLGVRKVLPPFVMEIKRRLQINRPSVKDPQNLKEKNNHQKGTKNTQDVGSSDI